jgi:hypothetical protein
LFELAFFPIFMFPMFIFACSLAFMFACTFAFAVTGVAVGLGDAVTTVVELALPLLLEFSAVLQAVPKTAKANKVRKPVVRRIFNSS